MTTLAFRGYLYITGWYDGDTPRGYLIKADNEYEGSIENPVRFRVPVINAPELKGATAPAGIESRTWAINTFPVNKLYPCWHYGREEYGRMLVDPIADNGRQFSEMSLAAGMSVPYKK